MEWNILKPLLPMRPPPSPTGSTPTKLQSRHDFALHFIVSAVVAAQAGTPLADAAGPATLDALIAQLTENHFSLLHIVAHGRLSARDGAAALLLPDAAGRLQPVPAAQLLTRLGHVRRLPHHLFLSSCDSAAPTAALSARCGGSPSMRSRSARARTT